MSVRATRREAEPPFALADLTSHDINDTPLLSAQEERDLAARVAEGRPVRPRAHGQGQPPAGGQHSPAAYLNKGLCLEDLIEEGKPRPDARRGRATTA